MPWNKHQLLRRSGPGNQSKPEQKGEKNTARAGGHCGHWGRKAKNKKKKRHHQHLEVLRKTKLKSLRFQCKKKSLFKLPQKWKNHRSHFERGGSEKGRRVAEKKS